MAQNLSCDTPLEALKKFKIGVAHEHTQPDQSLPVVFYPTHAHITIVS